MKSKYETDAMGKLLSLIRGEDNEPSAGGADITGSSPGENNFMRRFHSRALKLLSRVDSSKRYGVGVDFGSFSMKFSVLEFNNGKGIMRDSRIMERGKRGEEEVVGDCIKALTESLKRVVGKWSYRDVPVYLAISDRKVLVKRVFLPKMPVREIRKALALKLENEIELASDRVVIGFRLNRGKNEGDEKNYEVTVAAASSDFLEEMIRPFEEAGFTDIRPVSASMIYGDMLNTTIPSMLVDIGLMRTGLYITSGGISHLYREIGIGGQNFTRSLTGRFSYSKGVLEFDEEVAENMKRKYGVSREKLEEDEYKDEATSHIPIILRPLVDKLSDEIKRTVEHASSSLRIVPRKLILVGGGSSMPGLAEHLGSQLELEVKSADHSDFRWEVSCTSKESIRFHEIAMAVEVALWKGNNELLIPSEYKWRRRSHFERKAFRYASLLSTALIVFFSILGKDIVAESKGNAVLIDSGKLMTMELGDDAQKLGMERKQLNQWKKMLNIRLPDGPDMVAILKELSNIIPNYILLTRLEVIPEAMRESDESASLAGEMSEEVEETENKNRFLVLMDGLVIAEPLFQEAYLSKFNLILNKSGFFDRTRIMSWERVKEKDMERLSFSISCRLGDWAGEG